MKVIRKNSITKTLERKSVLLLGPRRTGKSFFIRNQLGEHKYYNLLHADTFRRLSSRLSLIREELNPEDKLIVIDEIQKLPELMDEVHAMIEESPNLHFLLTGSSARKLKRSHTSLMAGRAKQMFFFPFTTAEIENFNLEQITNFGTLPPIWLSDDPYNDLLDYVGLYLKEEIRSEALVRNIENFSHFLEVAAKSNGKILNYSEIGRDAQVPPRTVKEYFHLLEDTLMGTTLKPIEQQGKRKAVSKSKFYFFDIGVVNALLERKSVSLKGPEFGDVFEHFIFLEIKNYIFSNGLRSHLNFWGIDNKTEVDIIIDKKIAIEVKASKLITEKHCKGLKVFSATYHPERKIIVSRDNEYRRIDDIEILPYQLFLKMLWDDEIITDK